jgi:hypothetical protein
VAIRTKRESVEDATKRLRTLVRRMETRYECSSEFMTSAVANGYMKETAEIARWLISHRTLNRLEARGSRSSANLPRG